MNKEVHKPMAKKNRKLAGYLGLMLALAEIKVKEDAKCQTKQLKN